MKLDKLYIVTILVFVVAVIVLTFAFPFRSLRQAALDNTMAGALQEVSEEIKQYTQKNDKLPADLTALEFKASYSIVNNNKGILNKITYNVVDDKNFTKKFSLCADFKTEQESSYKVSPLGDLPLSGATSSLYPSYSYVDYQTHPKGYHCFGEETVYSSRETMYQNLDDVYNLGPSIEFNNPATTQEPPVFN